MVYVPLCVMLVLFLCLRCACVLVCLFSLGLVCTCSCMPVCWRLVCLPRVYDDVGCLLALVLFHALPLSISLMHTYTGRRSSGSSLFTSGFILEVGVCMELRIGGDSSMIYSSSWRMETQQRNAYGRYSVGGVLS
nr:hypothetical protein [Tanacetum cinerariifolium]